MTDTIEAVARAHKLLGKLPRSDFDDVLALLESERQRAIASHTKALVDGAGELRCIRSVPMERTFGVLLWTPYDQAAATIAAQKAEIERLTEREAQAKLDGVRERDRLLAMIGAAGSHELSDVEAEAALTSEGIHTWGPDGERFERMFAAALKCRALDAEAIAKGEG